MYLNIFDSHTHSDTSWDAEHSITFLCETAVKKGILGFAITDHCEINEYESRDIEARIMQGHFEMLKARAAFGKSIMLSYGIELGQMNYDLNLTRHVLAMKPYDFVLGSLHCIRGDQDFYYMDFQGTDPYALLEEYYKELYEIAKLNLFDSMAHISYPIRYMNGKCGLGVDLSRMDDLIDLTLRTAGNQHLRPARPHWGNLPDAQICQTVPGTGGRIPHPGVRRPRGGGTGRRNPGGHGHGQPGGIPVLYVL